ncbi:MAG: hypothetical protein RL291_1462 [Pseudomonadota bacterium]
MAEIKGPGGAPVFGVVGWKKSGKTTLTKRLVEVFAGRGLRVATVKHAHHDFQIDNAETDSAKHRAAGAQQVAIVSSERWAMVRELKGAPEPDFADVLLRLDPCDLVIVEGYKSQPIPKIEARRSQSFTHDPLAPRDPNIVAIASDAPDAHRGSLPVFHLDDVAALADLMSQRLAIKARGLE